MSFSNGKTASLTEANLQTLGQESQELHRKLQERSKEEHGVKESSKVPFFKGHLAEKIEQKKARTNGSVDEYGFAKKVIGLSAFAAIELEKNHGDFSKMLANLAHFYSLTSIPKLSDVLASNIIGSKEMSIEEAGRTIILLAIKIISDNHLEPFFRVDNRATFPMVPSKEEILEFLISQHSSTKTLKQMSELEEGSSKHNTFLRLEIEKIEGKIQELEDCEDVEQMVYTNRRRLLRFTEAMNSYEAHCVKSIVEPDTHGLTAEEHRTVIESHQQRVSEAQRKKNEARAGFLHQVIEEDIKELEKEKRVLMREIHDCLSKETQIAQKMTENNIQLAKEADDLLKWHSKAISCFQQVCTMVVGAIKSMVATYLQESQAARLKTLMNELCIETGVTKAYDQGDLLSMILNLERHFASTSFMSGWAELFKFVNLKPSQKMTDEDYRVAYDRQAEMTIKAIGTESIKIKDLMCVLLLNRSQMGDMEFLQSIQTQQQVLGSKCTFEELQTDLQQLVNDYLTQRMQMISKGRGKAAQQPLNDAQTQHKKHQQQIKENSAFMAEPGKGGEYFCYENAAGRTCKFGQACVFAHKGDPNVLKENKYLCKETGRTSACSKGEHCKQVHTKELFISKKNKDKQTSPSAGASNSSVANMTAASASAEPTAVPRPIAAAKPSTALNAVYNVDDVDQFDDDGFPMGFMVDVVDDGICTSAATLRKSTNLKTDKTYASANVALDKAVWDSGAVRHITSKDVMDPRNSSTKIKGIGGTVHTVKAQGTYGNKTDVLQMADAAATVFSISQMVKPTAEGEGIVIMDNHKAVLIRGECAATLVAELLNCVDIQESATLRCGMYEDNAVPSGVTPAAPPGAVSEATTILPDMHQGGGCANLLNLQHMCCNWQNGVKSQDDADNVLIVNSVAFTEDDYVAIPSDDPDASVPEPLQPEGWWCTEHTAVQKAIAVPAPDHVSDGVQEALQREAAADTDALVLVADKVTADTDALVLVV